MSKLEDLVPDRKLCEQIPDGCFENTALAWDTDYERWYVAERETVEPAIAIPAPTLEEIIEAIKTNTHSKDNLCNHKYDIHYCAIDLKWIFCFGENFAVADTLSSAALKLWLELNKSDQSDQSDQSVQSVKFTPEVCREMYDALQKIANMNPGESYDEVCSIYEDCPTCYDMIDIAKEAMQKVKGEQ